MTREEEFELALAQAKEADRQAMVEAHARFLEARAHKRRAPAPVIRDGLDAAFAALRGEEARP